MKTYCISIHGNRYEMRLLNSETKGFYKYRLIPMELGIEEKDIYISPNREEHWMFGRPNEGGKLVDIKNIFYFLA